MFAAGILIGPSLTFTPSYSCVEQMGFYAHVGYMIGWGNGLNGKLKTNVQGSYYSFDNSNTCNFSANGLTSALGFSIAVKNFGIAFEFILNHYTGDNGINYTIDKRHFDYWLKGLRAKLFVKIGK